MTNDRLTIATAIAQSLRSIWTGPEGDMYDPPKTAADFVEDEKGTWYSSRDKKYYWEWRKGMTPATDFGPAFRLITTYEQRIAREAFMQADAILEASHTPTKDAAIRGLLDIIHDSMTHAAQEHHADEINAARKAIGLAVQE